VSTTDTHATTRQPTQHGTAATGDSGAWRATKFSVAFIIVALLTLLVLPPFLQRRTEDVRTRGSSVTISARDVSDDIERDLAEEVSAERGFALTGEAAYRAKFEAASRRHAVSFAELRPLVAKLDHRAPQRLAEFESALAAWEAAPGNALSGQLTRAQYVRLLPLQEQLFQQTIDAAANLDTEIRLAANANRSAADRAERLEVGLTILLAVLALVAVLLLGRLARGLRNAAIQEANLNADIAKLFESRARFIRGFTHDLKNPLGAADAYAQLLEEGVVADPVKFEHSLRRIRASIRAALRLINDVLDLARAEAGELPLKLEPLDITNIAGQVAEEYEAQAHAARLELEVEIDPGLPAVVSDELRVRQVLGNLLSNAIKYTPHGGQVGIRAFAREDGYNGHAHWTGIQVWDTGPGIPQDKREKIFDEFTRIDVTKPGVGLGLAISRRIAGALGGKLSLETGPDAGAKFTLWLPVPNGT
jgi:signal transduction histidine kinase